MPVAMQMFAAIMEDQDQLLQDCINSGADVNVITEVSSLFHVEGGSKGSFVNSYICYLVTFLYIS